MTAEAKTQIGRFAMTLADDDEAHEWARGIVAGKLVGDRDNALLVMAIYALTEAIERNRPGTT